MKLSIIDIGTQSIKHYIFEKSGQSKKMLHYKRYSDANLGEADPLSSEAIKRCIAILKECLETNKAVGAAKLKLIGTEILRKASNAPDFITEVRVISGEDIEIISQDKEALYLYEGFLDIVPAGQRFAAVNIGGGSTELVVGTSDTYGSSVKLPFGVKFLQRTFGQHDSAKWSEIDEYLGKEISGITHTPKLFITGVLKFMKAIEDSIPFVSKPSGIHEHPFELAMADYYDWLLRSRAMPVAELKKLYPEDPSFCEGVTFGQSVYYAIAKKLGAEAVIPSSRDLTDGVVYEMDR